MESPACADREPKVEPLKNDSVESEEKVVCNGFSEGGGKKVVGKRKKSEDYDGDNGKKAYMKLEDHGRGEIPAHHARRPPNGFLLFCKRHRDIVSAKNPNLENRGVTKLLGNWWRTLEEEEREKYKELARQNKEIFIANNPQFTWYKLPAPPLRTLVTRPSNRRPPKLDPSPITTAGPITPGKLADESQLGGLTSLLSSSVSPPSTPVNPSPPSPTSAAQAPPKKRFLLQTRTKQSDGNSLSESDETSDNKAIFKNSKKKYKKKKNWNSIKYKKALKMKWNESFSNNKVYLENEVDHPVWKTENGSPNCTQQQLIEKIVDSSFPQKPYQDFDIQRKLDCIHTEHTYQKNASRIWQQKQKTGKKEEFLPLQIVTKVDGIEPNIISPNVNNNTIVLTETKSEMKKENGLDDISYSFNDNNNLIINCVDVINQRKLDQSNIQTNHDRMTINLEDGYIPGMYAKLLQEDCDNTKGLEDQIKPFNKAQDDDIPKNCDKDSNFQSILGKVSRDIANMINEPGPESSEEMAVARFNIQSKSETESEGSWGYKSDTSPPSSPGGRRPKRSCKGQRYEQFIKDSVSKKRSKMSDLYSMNDYRKTEIKAKKRKSDFVNSSYDDLEAAISYNENAIKEEIKSEENEILAVKDEKKNSEASLIEQTKEEVESSSQSSEDLNVIEGVRASEIIQKKLELESKIKREGEEKVSRRHKDFKSNMKRKAMSKVQMIKEKRELQSGDFNLNEKIEELPLLSFESFLQKKRQRKKRLLGLKKECLKNKALKHKIEKYKSRDHRSLNHMNAATVPKKSTQQPGQATTKPDFADLTTLAETALTLLSLGEPRE